jgi:hypothetical protein
LLDTSTSDAIHAQVDMLWAFDQHHARRASFSRAALPSQKSDSLSVGQVLAKLADQQSRN